MPDVAFLNCLFTFESLKTVIQTDLIPKEWLRNFFIITAFQALEIKLFLQNVGKK